MAIINGTDGYDNLTGTHGNDTIYAKKGNDDIHDYGGDDTYLFYAGNGYDILQDYKGNDQIVLGPGITKNKIYFTRNGQTLDINFFNSRDKIGILNWFRRSDYVVEKLVFSDGSIITSSEIYNLININPNIISGTNSNDNLKGTWLNETIDGGIGEDTMRGGIGDDTYYVDNTGDVIIEYQNEGNDKVISSANYTVSSNIENLILTGNSNINATGNNLNNVITGNSGNNLLDGKAGADVLTGGLGNDIYFVDNISDIVTEKINEGTDTVNSSISYTLSSNFENLTLTGNSNINGTGNNSNNDIVGNSGNNILTGGLGDDSYIFNTNWGHDVIQDVSGNDSIKFGTGINKDDIAFSKSSSSLIISNNNSGGSDTIEVKNWYNGSVNKIEYLMFNNGSIMTAQDIDNSFQGGILIGTAINDTLTGSDRNDKIYGLEGNDIINGKAGSDIMIGGSGDDTYYVDNINDTIIEKVNSTASQDTSWISSAYIRDIYSRTYPHIAGNQWHVANDGMFEDSAVYTKVNGISVIDWTASWQKNDKFLQLIANNFDYISLNRDGSRNTVRGEYGDLFLDNYDSLYNPNKGLGATLGSIKQLNSDVYVLPYLTITDVRTYQSVNSYPEWNFWHSQQEFSGQNFGTYDYCNNNNLFLTKDGEILHFYYNSYDDGNRVAFDSNNPEWQQYYIDHVKGIIDAGFDGIFSDNWARSKFGDLTKLTDAEFYAVQQGWNAIGEGVKDEIGDNILIGNSPSASVYNSRDMQMLEDRIDDVLGTADKSVASYFKYSYLARLDNVVCQDTYFDESKGPFETFRMPLNLLTDNILGLGSSNSLGVSIENYIKPLVTIGDIGNPLGDRQIIETTDTGIDDKFYNYTVDRAVYVRYYSQGVVYLNDTGGQQTISLPEGSWLRSDGVTFAGGDSITLDSLRGWVFKKTDGVPLSITEGNDTVISSISYTLSSNVENLILAGVSDINAVGNSLDNILTGNDGNNILNGAKGKDTLIGNSGDDVYIFNIGDGKDSITDILGNDTIKLGNLADKNKAAFFIDVAGNLSLDYGNFAGNDKITVNNWNIQDNQIEKIQLNDGTFITNVDLNQTIQQMVAYAANEGITVNTVEDVKNNSELMNMFMVNSWHS